MCDLTTRQANHTFRSSSSTAFGSIDRTNPRNGPSALILTVNPRTHSDNSTARSITMGGAASKRVKTEHLCVHVVCVGRLACVVEKGGAYDPAITDDLSLRLAWCDTLNSSLEELLTPDDSVDMRKATLIIWRNRHRPEVISELADLLSEVSQAEDCN